MAKKASGKHESLAASAYSPPPQARPELGTIVDLLPRAVVLPGARLKEVFLAYLPTLGRIAPKEVLYFHTTRLDLDTDGKTTSWGKTKAESSHQGQTSLDKRAHSHKIDKENSDSNVLPYFVLPLRDAKTDSEWVGKDHGVMLGDVGVIIGKNKVVFAQFADAGPAGKLGEASIAVHRAFGQDDVTGRARLRNTDLGGPFVTLVFPGTAPPKLRLTPTEIATLGRTLFTKLGGLA
ncbi:MAG: glycoside hydrolase family 75 protein [Byssovorax sp.]